MSVTTPLPGTGHEFAHPHPPAATSSTAPASSRLTRGRFTVMAGQSRPFEDAQFEPDPISSRVAAERANGVLSQVETLARGF